VAGGGVALLAMLTGYRLLATLSQREESSEQPVLSGQ